MIILDTNVISEWIRPVQDSNVVQWLSSQRIGDCFITTITEAELRLGVELLPAGKRRKHLLLAIDDLLDREFSGRILAFNRPAAAGYARIVSHRTRLGRPILEFDAQIAAIALVHKATLATRNISDFDRCGIKVINPWDAPGPAKPK